MLQHIPAKIRNNKHLKSKSADTVVSRRDLLYGDQAKWKIKLRVVTQEGS